jgi:hypothetical protein
VFLLSITGSLAQSYLRTRLCPRCGDGFSFENFLSFPSLGIDLRPQIFALKEAQAWDLVIGRFQVFIHCYRGGHCERDEEALFEALNELYLD